MSAGEKYSNVLKIKKLKYHQVEDELGFGRNTLRNAIQENRQLSPRLHKEFMNYFMINPKWWETSEGKIFLEKHTSVEENKISNPSFGNEAVKKEIRFKYVPLVNQYAYAGYMSGFSDPEYMEELPKIPFQVDQEGKGNYVCFEMRGESMFDGSYQSLIEGDHLLAREIQRQHWQNKLHINKYRFVIVHKEEGILVKYITKHDVANNTILVHSLNPEFEDVELNLNDVAQIFNVVKVQRS